MTKEELKDKLISINYCKDSIFLDDYVSLILYNVDENNLGSQKHHIIPRHYYVHNNLDVDNSNDNLVILSYKDHIKAHLYLVKCCINMRDIKANSLAALNMLGNNTRLSKANIESVDDVYEFVDSISDDYNPLTLKGLENNTVSIRNSDRNVNSKWFNDGKKEYFIDLRDGIPNNLLEGRLNASNFAHCNLNKIAVNNGKINKYINTDQLEYYISIGFSKGIIDRGDSWRESVKNADRSYMDDEFRRKSGLKVSNWYKERPGYRNSGMWGQRPPDNKGKIWITNGTINKYIDPNDTIPDGWRKGCTQKKKSKLKN